MLDKVRLDEITTFPKLLDYLRDELDWPIEEESFDDLTFDYAPADFDLKLDGEKGRIEIKQLRPLVSTQPWGIFFLNFPGKDMPVTVLRRILGKLARKKRASQNPAERAVWDKNDLLFIASFGKTGERQLSFAHFQDRSDVGDLPALRVLGWDGQNTIRRLSFTNDILKSRLCWPNDPRDLQSWRERWGGAFTEGKGESVATSKAMAQELARLARQIRARANELLDAETEQGPLRQLHSAFREALIHDLKPDDFADMYAQTIAYGLLSARIARASGALTADDAALMAPATNPFLQELLKNFLQAGGRKGGMDFDELGVNEVVEMLREANMEAVLRDFDDRNPQEDPVIHFYELFLKEYDAKKRMQRGVFYTPRPVVSFIVRSVDEVLRTEFGLEDGLADTATWGEMAARKPEISIPVGVKPIDPFVKVLDPATGTGTFLVEVIGLVHDRMVEKWRKAGRTKTEIDDLWNGYVPEHLLPRLYGFELMMAPYAIAHMKVGVKLADTGYHFRSKERARIYLTNALEEPRDFDMQLAFMSEALAHEAQAANAAKANVRFTVVTGNPPYKGSSQNPSKDQSGKLTFAGRLIQGYFTVDGQALGEKNPKWIHNDYVKFLALAEATIKAAGSGVLGFITSHSWLDSPTFRGVRANLMAAFHRLWIVDLHGNIKKREVAPDNSQDEGVFEIEEGTNITVGLHKLGREAGELLRGDLFGRVEQKFRTLAETTVSTLPSQSLSPQSPLYLLTLRTTLGADEYNQYCSLREIFSTNVLGFQTHRDAFAIDIDKEALLERISEFGRTESIEEFAKTHRIKSTRDWSIASARKSVLSIPVLSDAIDLCAYRPFDNRYTMLGYELMDYPRREILTHVKRRVNLCLNAPRQLNKIGFRHVLISNVAPESCFISNGTREQNYVFPLWLEPDSTSSTVRPNIDDKFTSRIQHLTSLSLIKFDIENNLLERGDLENTVGARDILDWTYAILHSPGYRRRYADFLKSDFAKIPLPRDRDLFKAVIALGTRLVALHVIDTGIASSLEEPADVRIAGTGDAAIPSTGGQNGYPRFVNGRVYVNPDRWFEDVPEATWEFGIGSYQVCDKWLKDRRGRTLSVDDILHYRRIVHALTETGKLMAEIDKVIEAHGGWPDAFRGMAD